MQISTTMYGPNVINITRGWGTSNFQKKREVTVEWPEPDVIVQQHAYIILRTVYNVAVLGLCVQIQSVGCHTPKAIKHNILLWVVWS